ncbi:hypothetical protein VNO78_25650 [Psophocarpus tetragonolobus]|uniref:Leucine-rich repeat-containing N-terminal plant-type domain-containing protein n=1 Tax=Psophocarpus tetragonolobus TaxID=3891 RepID=A0AAN9XFL8_PSOTE
MKLVSSILLFSFYWLCLCNHVFVISGPCLNDQRSLLQQFKKNLTFRGRADRSSSRLNWWNASDDCCKWMGVTCDKEGHVTALDLSKESISGGFDNSSSLFSLQHLQKLNLAYNHFNSVIPSGFNRLENLSYLNLSRAGFLGQIPIEISQLTRLVTLDLSSFYFSFGRGLKLENPNLEKILQNLTSIRQLYLDGVSITSKWWSPLLLLHDLQELSMSFCGLSGHLNPSLARLENLSVIVLDNNNFSSPVPETFAYFKNLTVLSLVSCELTGTFPHKVFNIGTLLVIDISWNENLHGFFPDIPLNGYLQTLRLRGTNFTGGLPHSMGNMRHLSELDLHNCGFDGTIPNSLSNLTKLSYLDLSFNNFNSSSSHFEGLHNLVYIDLSCNSLTGTVPSSLFALSSLQYIQLSGNKFSQLDEIINLTSSKAEAVDISFNKLSGRIPPSLFSLPLVQVIQLSHNQFSQLDEIKNVSKLLFILDLSNNNVSGPFPTSVFGLSTLSVLQLSSNRFYGSVNLNKLLQLKNLTELDISYNNLSVNANVTNADSSSLPSIWYLNLSSCNLKTFPFLRNMYAIKILDLSANKIEGSVPNWIWVLHNIQVLNISHNLFTELEGPLKNLPSNLYILDLHDNKFQGPIPIFPKLGFYMDFSSNKFSSFIPRDIGNYLSRTTFLSLANNALHGSIPDSLCKALLLELLDLSNNKISGLIPSCLINISATLRVLNLKNNNLSGHIPNVVPNSCNLWTLNLGGNQLNGPIPKSLAYCSKLEVLDLGSNQIIGGFPCSLQEISTLRIMVLRNNKFQGSLRCSKTNKTWEMLQIVDIAFNNFNGKLPKNYFTTWKRFIMQNDPEIESKFIGKDFLVESYGIVYYQYQDRVAVVTKGQPMELVKILTFFTLVDFSSNHFEGPIPEELMNFKELHILNLSNNVLSGKIPSSIGNLRQLESLDLSQNSLGGEIPVQLASLSFLSYLNLSFNHLVGKIPMGTQIQSFSASSFEGNNGLYGSPLTENSDGEDPTVLSKPECGRLTCTIDWNFISIELGLIFGHGIVIGPLLIWKQWRLWYWQLIHTILCWIFPQLYVEYVTNRGQTYATLRWQC